MSAPATGAVEVTTVQFEVCWSLLGLPELPYSLDLPSPGATHAERRAIERSALSQLAARGLAEAERPGAWLSWALHQLAHPSWAVDAWTYSGTAAVTEPQRTARAAAIGEHAVLAVLSGQSVQMQALSDHAAFPVLAAMTGPEQRPRTAAARLPTAVLEQLTAAAAKGTLAQVVDELVDDGESEAQVRAAAHALRGRLTHGEFRITVADGHGGTRRLPDRIRWHTTPEGHFLRTENGDWSSLTPCGHEHIATRLRQLTGC